MTNDANLKGPQLISGWLRGRVLVVISIALGLRLFLGANAHLVYVALTSQPTCVPHAKAPSTEGGMYRAAKSSC